MAASQGRNAKITIVSFHGLLRELAAARLMMSQYVFSRSAFLFSYIRVTEMFRTPQSWTVTRMLTVGDSL